MRALRRPGTIAEAAAPDASYSSDPVTATAEMAERIAEQHESEAHPVEPGAPEATAASAEPEEPAYKAVLCELEAVLRKLRKFRPAEDYKDVLRAFEAGLPADIETAAITEQNCVSEGTEAEFDAAKAFAKNSTPPAERPPWLAPKFATPAHLALAYMYAEKKISQLTRDPDNGWGRVAELEAQVRALTVGVAFEVAP